MDEFNYPNKKVKYHPNICIAQFAVGVIFIINVSCAVAFILYPEKYMGGFEVFGDQGRVLVRALGILFLMWNATYPPVIFAPIMHKTLFRVILLQQTIGLFGESWLMLTLPGSHAALRATGLRFIVFDGFGLLLMGLAYLLVMKKTISLFDK